MWIFLFAPHFIWKHLTFLGAVTYSMLLFNTHIWYIEFNFVDLHKRVG